MKRERIPAGVALTLAIPWTLFSLYLLLVAAVVALLAQRRANPNPPA